MAIWAANTYEHRRQRRDVRRHAQRPFRPPEEWVGMRLCLVTVSLDPGGAERVTVRLANAWTAAGHEVSLVVGRADGALRPLVDRAVTTVELGHRQLSRSLPALVQHLRRSRPDRVLASLLPANVLTTVACALARRPLPVLWEHTTLRPYFETEPGARRLHRAVVRWVYPRAAGVVTVSEGAAADLRALLAPRRAAVHVLPNPIVPWPPEPGAIGDPPRRTSEKPLVAWVGRLEAAKDPLTALRVFALVRREVDARLVIVGDGSLRKRVREEVERLGLAGCIRLTGFDPAPATWMRCADVLLHTSVYEGMPSVIVEALAAGTPVVATDCPSGPAEVLTDRAWSELAAVGDVEGLARGVIRLLAARPAVPEHAWARFRVDTAARRFAEVLA